jgi:C-methyltransferase
MTAKAGADIAAILSAYDFTPFTRIADIAGGRGHLLRAVLGAAPTAEGVLFDLPIVIDSLTIDEPRVTAQAGDFFVNALPVADAYLLLDVLHDWPDERCVAILSAVRRAAPAESVVLVIEDVVAEERDDPRASTLDIVMLTVTGGRERTARELGALLATAGFHLDEVIDTPSSRRIVQARPI